MGQVVLDISMSLDGFITGPIDLEGTRVVAAPDVTHLRFHVVK